MTWFDLAGHRTTVATEVRGGITTFLTMAYILVANPAILAAAGIPFEAAAAATAAAAAVCTLLMGVAANFPIALAPGMGLNAVVAYQITAQAGSWQAAMGLVIVNGLVILILVAVGVREAVMDAIPIDLRRAISVGIGLFLALIGAVNAGIVVVPPSSIATLGSNPQALVPPVTHGSLHAPEPLLAFGALVVMALLLARRVSGALLIGIAVATLAALLLGVTKWPDSWFRLPRFDTMFQADVRRAFDPALLPVLVSLIMVDFFDTLGSVTAVAETGRLHDERGRIPRLRAILAVDSIGAAIGGAFGVSSVTSYVESAAGVSEGARTGLHNVVVAALFAACMFAAPMVTVVPAAAAGAALIVVGFLMCQQIAKMDFTAIDTAVPAFLILLLTPLTYSISHGIGYGFIAYVAIKVLHGRGRDVRPMMYVATVMFAAYFWIG